MRFRRYEIYDVETKSTTYIKPKEVNKNFVFDLPCRIARLEKNEYFWFENKRIKCVP